MSRVRLLVSTLLAFATALCFHEGLRFLKWRRPLTIASVAPGGVVPAAQRALRPNYPYSVIPGGAYSPAELRNAISNDGVVRGHYTDFDLKSVRMVTITSDRFQYASYRVRDQVYWTRGKIRISKGEILLTDGIHFARSRCGNRLCDTPQSAVAPEEPSLRALSLPQFSFQLLADEELSLAHDAVPGELAQAYRPLHFDLPQMEPFVPLSPFVSGSAIEHWIPAGGEPVAAPSPPAYFSSPPPNNSVSLLALQPPSPPLVTAEAPEPASVYLFVTTCAVSLWLLTHWVRGEADSEAGVTEDGN